MPPATTAQELTNAYGAWATRFQEDGWQPYLLTLMFRQLRGSPAAVARQMEREAERVYSRFVTRAVRNPRSAFEVGRLPVWICSPDYPVFKHAKHSLSDVTINDGRHLHVVELHPPRSRLKTPVDEHFAANQDLYVRLELPLLRIDARPITHDLRYVVEYTQKAMLRGLVDADGVFLLPRSRLEMSSRIADRRAPNPTASITARG